MSSTPGDATLITADPIEEELMEEVRSAVAQLPETPHLGIVFVGDSDASAAFIAKKQEACERVGCASTVFQYDADIGEDELLAEIAQLNDDPDVHGILPQLPLPAHIDENAVFGAVSPEKDVDGLTEENLGKLLRGADAITPCTVGAILRMLEHEAVALEGADVTVINNSNLIGKPLALALTRRDATVTVCHEKTDDLEQHTRDADVVVTATGVPGLMTGDMLDDEAVVIDAGYSRVDGEPRGDVDMDSVRPVAAKVTPVPGGVGPLTVAMVIQNLVTCYRMQQDA